MEAVNLWSGAIWGGAGSDDPADPLATNTNAAKAAKATPSARRPMVPPSAGSVVHFGTSWVPLFEVTLDSPVL